MNDTFKQRGMGRPCGQAGLTLTETLVALALASIVLLALFQSASMWLTLSGRSAAAAENALTGTLAARQFDRVVRGLTPSWPEDAVNQFRGGPQGFSGLTRRPLQALSPMLSPAAMEIVQDGVVSRLAYRSGSTNWMLESMEPGSGEFSYLGADGGWRRAWPPENAPESGPFNDARFLPPPALPLAVKLSYRDPQGRRRDLIAPIVSDPALPLRDRDLVGQ